MNNILSLTIPLLLAFGAPPAAPYDAAMPQVEPISFSAEQSAIDATRLPRLTICPAGAPCQTGVWLMPGQRVLILTLPDAESCSTAAAAQGDVQDVTYHVGRQHCFIFMPSKP